MSWEPYLNEHLIKTGKVSKAAVISLVDGQIWAQTAGTQISTEEAKYLVAAIKEDANVQEKGPQISGEKYFALSVDRTVGQETIQLKKGADGACVCKTKQTIVVGVYKAPVQQTECYTVVYNLAQYFQRMDY